MGEKFEVYLNQQYMGQADTTMPDIESKPETEPGEPLNSEELSFEVELSGLASNEELWELIRKASEAGEKAAMKLEEWAAEMALAFASWNELAGLASEAVKQKQPLRYMPGVYMREELTNVSDPRRVLDRLAQENKPPG